MSHYRKGASEFLVKLADNEKLRDRFAPLLDTFIEYLQTAPRAEVWIVLA